MTELPTETVWTPVERSFHARRRHADPYRDVALTATFEHESGESHDVPGFWDGDDTWRVRFAPTRPGRWEYAVESDASDPGLTGEGAFLATDYEGPNPLRRHGFLRAAGRGLEHDDGTPFVWLADTAWAAGAKATPREWERYLTARHEQGFTAVQVNALPQHDASRPWDRLPFGDDWDLDRPDPEYFRALDDLAALTHGRGLALALVALWFNYAPGTWPDWDGADRHPMDETQAARFGRYLGARYGAYGTVWLVSGDTNYETDDEAALAVYDAAAAAIGEAVTHPLRTTHMVGGLSTPERVADRDWVEFQLYQSGHVTDRALPAEMAVECRSRAETPVVNGEPPYERHGYFDADGSRVSRAATRAAAWLSVLAGASAGVTYGGHGVWQWHRDGERFAGAGRVGSPDPWDEAVEFPGARDYGRLAAFLGQFAVDRLTPRQGVLAGDPDPGLVRAAALPGATLVYAAEGGDLRLDTAVDGPARWVDPATGASVPASTTDGQEVVVHGPPWDGDALLWVERG